MQISLFAASFVESLSFSLNLSLTSERGIWMQAGDKCRRARRRRRKVKLGEEAKKRRLSEDQVKFLETNFGRERKLESGRKVKLAAELGLEPKQVAVWFQNRRARWKSKQIEEEYVRLKFMHDSLLLDKCSLEAEVSFSRFLSHVLFFYSTSLTGFRVYFSPSIPYISGFFVLLPAFSIFSAL